MPSMKLGALDRWMIAGTLLACAVALSPNLTDPDLWGHVEYGRDAIQFGIPATTSYSYTAVGFPWVNHELLAEFLQAKGMDTLGPVGMLVAKCLLGLTLIGGIVLSGLRRGLSTITVCAMALLVSVNLTYFWCMRPQLLSFTCFAAMLAVFSFCFRGWEGNWWLRRRPMTPETSSLTYSPLRMRALWLLPVVIAVWTNSHGGFIAGVAIALTYLVCRSVEWCVQNRGRDLRLLHRFALVAMAILLATFVNPYGPGLHLGLAHELGIPRPEILEWRPPNLLSPLMLPLILMIVLWTTCMAFTKAARDFTQTVIMSALLWQSLTHQRHIPFFAIACGFWLPVHVESLLLRLKEGRATSEAVNDATSPRWQQAFVGLMIVAFTLGGWNLYGRLSVLSVPRNQYPVTAFQYIADRQLDGRMVITFNWAQYAIAAFGKKSTDAKGIEVQFDGRYRTCYPQHVLDMHFDFILPESEPRCRTSTFARDPARVLNVGDPDLVVVCRDQPQAVNVMFREADRWTLLYQDKLAQVWGRASRYDDPLLDTYVPTDLRSISNDAQTGTVPWPALPVRTTRPVANAIAVQNAH